MFDDIEAECWFYIERAAIAYAQTIERWSSEWFLVYATADWIAMGKWER